MPQLVNINDDLNIDNLHKIDIYLSKIMLKSIGAEFTENDIKTANETTTLELYKIIANNYTFCNKIYTILVTRYKKPTPLNIATRHIIFISTLLAFIKDISFSDRVSTTLPRYKIYNTYKNQTELLLTTLDEITAQQIDYLKELLIILQKLCREGLIKRELKRVDTKTEIFYKVDLIQNITYHNFTHSYSKYKTLIKNGIPYLCGLSIYSIKKLIKPNPHNTTTSQIDLSGLDLLNSTPILIDQKLLQIAIDTFKKHHNQTISDTYTNITKILENCRTTLKGLRQELYTIDHEVDNINITVGDDKLLKQFKKNFKHKLVLETDLDNIKKSYSRELSKEIEKLNFLKFIEVAQTIGPKPFYIPHHADFRGRIYSSSQLSPILHKYIRYILTYTPLNSTELQQLEENIQKTKTYQILTKYVDKLNGLNLKINRPIVHITLLFLFVELSKKYKTKLMDTITFSVELETLIIEGLRLYQTEQQHTNFEEDLEYRKILFHIESLKNGEIHNNFTLAKDSTASVLQHLFKWLDADSKTALKICNIDGLET